MSLDQNKANYSMSLPSAIALFVSTAALSFSLSPHIFGEEESSKIMSSVKNTETVYIADIKTSNKDVILSDSDRSKIEKLIGANEIVAIKDTPFGLYETFYLDERKVEVRYVSQDFRYSLLGDLFDSEGKNLSKHTKAFQEAQRSYQSALEAPEAEKKQGSLQLIMKERNKTIENFGIKQPKEKTSPDEPVQSQVSKPITRSYPSTFFSQNASDNINQEIKNNLKNTVIPEMKNGTSFEQQAALLLSEQFNNLASIKSADALRNELARLEAEGNKVSPQNPMPSPNTMGTFNDHQESAPQLSANGDQKIMSKIGFDRNGKQISPQAKIEQVKALTESLPMEYTVNYPAKGEEKLQLFVFSDPTCEYCRRFHSDIPRFQENGVTVRYLYYPRSGVKNESPKAQQLVKSMNNTWCSSDPAKAVDMMYAGLPVADGNCDLIPEERKKMGNVIYQHYILGQFFNLRYTPSFFTNTGHTFFTEGYSDYNSFSFKLKLLMGE